MHCTNCGEKIKENSKFCGKCGHEIKTASFSENNKSTATLLNTTTPSSDSLENKSGAIIKCGNCGYIGAGEPARSLIGKILAWICVVFAPLITIIYFVATHKWRCPKCKSTFLGVKNEHGVFVGQTGGANRIVAIFVCVLVGIAIMGILASVVLASLNTARAKGADASIKANLANARAQAVLYYDQNGNSYQGVCTSTEGVLSSKNSASEASGGGVVCNDTAIAWAMSSPLKTNPSDSWCVDSLDTNKEISGGIADQTSCSSTNSSNDTSNINNSPTLTGAEMCAQNDPNSTWDGKSYTSDGNSYQCSCKKGYQASSGKCMTLSDSCNDTWLNTYSTGINKTTGKNTCDCKAGYVWNSGQTACESANRGCFESNGQWFNATTGSFCGTSISGCTSSQGYSSTIGLACDGSQSN